MLDEEDDFEEFKLPSTAAGSAGAVGAKAKAFGISARAVSKDNLDKATWDDEDGYDNFQESLKKEIMKVGK